VNLFLRELVAYRKSIITWSLSLAGLAVLFMAMYPGFSSDVEGLRNVLEQFPAAIKSAFNLTAETFLTAAGFFGYVLNFGILAGAIQAMNLGTGVISKEVAGKTADFLLSKPLTKTRVFTSKLLAVFLAIVVTNLVFVAVSYASLAALAPDEFEPTTILLLAATLFLVQLVFLALGVLMGVVLPKVKSVVSVSLPTVFGFYIIGALGDVVGNDEVRYVSPFRYFEPQYIIKNQALDSTYLLIAAAVVIVALVLGYAIFLKKDIQSST
jgi:ABC-2 type transport system permease protein